ncbi:MAG: SRP-less Sec system protein [Leptospira sp.]|nr:SRP-less Sec system protein [Leptospira sp.]
MKSYSLIFCIIFLFVNLPVFSQADEGADFLDKVSDEKPKKVAKQTRKNVKIKPRKRFRKKAVRQNPNFQNGSSVQKPIKPEIKTTKPPEELKVVSPEKSYTEGIWVDEELSLKPDNIPGFKESSGSPAESVSVQKKVIEFLSDRDKKPEVKAEGNIPKQESFLDSFYSGLSNYKKILIIFGLVILFAIYRIRVGAGRSTRGSPTTINRYRKR